MVSVSANPMSTRLKGESDETKMMVEDEAAEVVDFKSIKSAATTIEEIEYVSIIS